MTNLHERYLAGHGFDITTPRLKTDYRSTTLSTVLQGPVNMRACMCACSNVCAPERACVYVGDGWDGEIGGFKWFMCVCACARVRDPACMRVTLWARME